MKNFVMYYNAKSAYEAHGTACTVTVLGKVLNDRKLIAERLSNSTELTERAYCEVMLENIERAIFELDLMLIRENCEASFTNAAGRFTVAYSTADEALEAYHADDIDETISKCNDDRNQAIGGLQDALNETERAYYQGLLNTIDSVQDELIARAIKQAKEYETMQKQLLINIGLEQGATYYDPKGYLNGSEKQPLERVLSLLGRVLPDLKLERVLEATSNTERTLVIKAHTHGNMDAVQRSLDTLSGLLGQQAIAFTLNGSGAMAKHPTEPPRDSSWLVFNPEYFLIAGLPVSLEQFTE